MLTKYFMRGINIQKYSNVFLEEHIFSHVGCLSLSGFDKISEAVFETGTSLTEKAEQERKRLQNVYAPMLCVLGCVLLTGKVKLFLEVKNEERERECCLCKSKCERMRSWKTRIYIGNPCHVVISKCARQNQRCWHSCEHKSRDFPGQQIPETD